MDEPGVPLAHYLRDHHGVTVRFHCEACGRSFDTPLSDVVERLKARGLGDEQTGIREVSRHADKPCRCGAMKWTTRPGFSVQ